MLLINEEQKSYCLKLLNSNPIDGISILIRKKYAFIGFFYSFFSLLRQTCVEDKVYDEDKVFDFTQFLKTYGIDLVIKENLISSLTRLIFFESSQFKETFNEDSISEDEINISFTTLEFLVAELNNPNNSLINQLQLLVLISYLTIDFNVFDNQKIKLVRNILPVLITSIEAADDISKNYFIGFDGNLCSQDTKALGVCNADSSRNEQMPVCISGIALVYTGASLSIGDPVTSDANARAVPADPFSVAVSAGSTPVTSDAAQPDLAESGALLPQSINGFALDAAAGADELIRILLC